MTIQRRKIIWPLTICRSAQSVLPFAATGDRTGTAARSVRLACALFAAIASTPALADLSPHLARAIDVCLAPDMPFAARMATLTGAGWQPLQPDEAAAAAQAHAPALLIRTGRLAEDQPLAERADHLLTAADRMLRQIDADMAGELWLTPGDGATWLHIVRPSDELMVCTLAADIAAADIALQVGVAVERRQWPFAELDFVLTGDGRADSVAVMTYLPGTFGELSLLPVVSFPQIRMATE